MNTNLNITITATDDASTVIKKVKDGIDALLASAKGKLPKEPKVSAPSIPKESLNELTNFLKSYQETSTKMIEGMGNKISEAMLKLQESIIAPIKPKGKKGTPKDLVPDILGDPEDVAKEAAKVMKRIEGSLKMAREQIFLSRTEHPETLIGMPSLKEADSLVNGVIKMYGKYPDIVSKYTEDIKDLKTEVFDLSRGTGEMMKTAELKEINRLHAEANLINKQPINIYKDIKYDVERLMPAIKRYAESNQETATTVDMIYKARKKLGDMESMAVQGEFGNVGKEKAMLVGIQNKREELINQQIRMVQVVEKDTEANKRRINVEGLKESLMGNTIRTQEKFNSLLRDIRDLTEYEKKSGRIPSGLSESQSYIKRIEKEHGTEHAKALANIQLAENRLIKADWITPNMTKIGKMREFMADVTKYASFQIRWFASATSLFAIAGALSAATKATMEFYQALKNIQAITGITDKQLKVISNAAIEVAKTTPISANEAAKMGLKLIQTGLNATEAAEAMKTVSAIVTVTGEDMNIVSQTVTTAMLAWKKEAKDIPQIGNTIAAALNFSRLTVQDLGTAFNYLAATSSIMGRSLEETTAIMAVLSNMGIRASTIGTGMGQLYTQLLSPTKKLRIELDRIGLSAAVVNPVMNDMVDILRKLEKGGFSATQAMIMLGMRAGRQLAALLIEGSDGLEEMNRRIKESKQLQEGLAKAMEGPINAIKGMVAQIGAMIIQIGSVAIPIIIGFTSAIKWWGEGLLIATKWVSNLVDKIGSTAVNVLFFGGIVALLSLNLYKVYAAAKLAAGGVTLLNLALSMAAPWKILLSIGTLLASLSLIGKAFGENKEKLKETEDITKGFRRVVDDVFGNLIKQTDAATTSINRFTQEWESLRNKREIKLNFPELTPEMEARFMGIIKSIREIDEKKKKRHSIEERLKEPEPESFKGYIKDPFGVLANQRRIDAKKVLEQSEKEIKDYYRNVVSDLDTYVKDIKAKTPEARATEFMANVIKDKKEETVRDIKDMKKHVIDEYKKMEAEIEKASLLPRGTDEQKQIFAESTIEAILKYHNATDEAMESLQKIFLSLTNVKDAEEKYNEAQRTTIRLQDELDDIINRDPYRKIMVKGGREIEEIQREIGRATQQSKNLKKAIEGVTGVSYDKLSAVYKDKFKDEIKAIDLLDEYIKEKKTSMDIDKQKTSNEVLISHQNNMNQILREQYDIQDKIYELTHGMTESEKVRAQWVEKTRNEMDKIKERLPVGKTGESIISYLMGEKGIKSVAGKFEFEFLSQEGQEIIKKIIENYKELSKEKEATFDNAQIKEAIESLENYNKTIFNIIDYEKELLNVSEKLGKVSKIDIIREEAKLTEARHKREIEFIEERLSLETNLPPPQRESLEIDKQKLENQLKLLPLQTQAQERILALETKGLIIEQSLSILGIKDSLRMIDKNKLAERNVELYQEQYKYYEQIYKMSVTGSPQQLEAMKGMEGATTKYIDASKYYRERHGSLWQGFKEGIADFNDKLTQFNDGLAVAQATASSLQNTLSTMFFDIATGDMQKYNNDIQAQLRDLDKKYAEDKNRRMVGQGGMSDEEYQNQRQKLQDQLKTFESYFKDFWRAILKSMIDQLAAQIAGTLLKGFTKLFSNVKDAADPAIIQTQLLTSMIQQQEMAVRNLTAAYIEMNAAKTGKVITDYLGWFGIMQGGETPKQIETHTGGYIMHSGGLAPDERMALVQTGEYVVSRKGVAALDRINQGQMGNPNVNIVMNVENNTEKPVDAKAGNVSFDGEKYIIGVVLKNIENNGPLRRAVGR